MLDNNVLAAFTSARRSDRSTLKAALGLMAKVYGPPSACRHHFYARRKADTETVLAYRTALLALADAAFPRMDEEGQDAMVLEQLLKLAQDLGVPINTADEIDISSLRVATSIQAHEVLQRKQGVVCNAAVASAPGPVVTEPQVVSPREEAFTTGRPGDWRSGGRSPLRSARKLEQPRSPTTLITCYNCGLRGHVASGCCAPRQRAMGPRLDDDQGPKSSLLTPASRGTSHARPTCTTHMGRRVAAEESRLGFGNSVRRGGFGRDRGNIKWSELGHRIVAASAGSSVVTGFIDGVEQGTVLAHAARIPAAERLVAQVDPSPTGNITATEDLVWADLLCADSNDLSTSAAAVTDAFVQGYVLDKGAPERLLTDQGKNFSSKLLQEVCNLLGVSELTAADHRRPDLHGATGPSRPDPRRPELPEPPDGRQRPVPYDGPARRTRARSRNLL
ncbi:unnamed protein product [Lampetra planeri]